MQVVAVRLRRIMAMIMRHTIDDVTHQLNPRFTHLLVEDRKSGMILYCTSQDFV
jgi:hypothetical protein